MLKVRNPLRLAPVKEGPNDRVLCRVRFNKPPNRETPRQRVCPFPCYSRLWHWKIRDTKITGSIQDLVSLHHLPRVLWRQLIRLLYEVREFLEVGISLCCCLCESPLIISLRCMLSPRPRRISNHQNRHLRTQGQRSTFRNRSEVRSQRSEQFTFITTSRVL